ncbi:uncharacterized protein LOC143832629 isoform X2 [Paroedura picta]|uniref:uncharacterized protein LOC143832629 isoform X2 n=1 Tax=Paroedura picta TaxID=143630 RepID=UPI00405726D0
METSYTKWNNSEQVNVLMEGQNKAQESKGFHNSEFFKRKVIYSVILGIGFLSIIALHSQSLINDSKMFKEIDMRNAQSSNSSLCFNSSKEISESGLKIDLFHAESRNESAAARVTKENLIPSLLEEVALLREENKRIAEDATMVLEGLHNLTAAQVTKENLIPSLLEEVALLREGNKRIAEDATMVLEGLHNLTAIQGTQENLIPSWQELREENIKIAEDVTRVLEGLHNLTESLCIKCPPNWVSFEEHCYFFSTLSKPWMVGKQSCQNEGAHLIIINNRLEMKFLVSQTLDDEVFWIGLTDAGKEGQWRWVDDTSLSFSSWGKGEPNNAGQGEDCATLRSNGKWNDALCSGNEMWICERKC